MRITSLSRIQRKSHAPRNIVFIAFMLAFILALTITIISVHAAWKLIHPDRLDIPGFSANIVPKYSNVSFKDIQDELILRGWYFDVIGSSKTLIIAHDYASNRLPYGEETIHIIKEFLDEGYNVLTFDFRNSGESDGGTTTMGLCEKNDVLGAVRFTKNKGATEIVVMGLSMGASCAIWAAAECDSIDAVIADSPFSSLDDFIGGGTNLPKTPFSKTVPLAVKVITGLDFSVADPWEVVGKLSPRPLLLIHSRDDTKTPIQNSRLIYESADTKNTILWEMSGVDHGECYLKDPDKYIQKIIEFLNPAKEIPNNPETNED
ncbi:MAG: alpha/beta hydrolase [Clostridium sp.]|nr:alpha/beta hydrolase [Clostridium sp.]